MRLKPAWLHPFVTVCCRASSLLNQLDKLGVTGSSLVPPTSEPAGSGRFFVERVVSA
jgi:hypothetical protein